MLARPKAKSDSAIFFLKESGAASSLLVVLGLAEQFTGAVQSFFLLCIFQFLREWSENLHRFLTK